MESRTKEAKEKSQGRRKRSPGEELWGGHISQEPKLPSLSSQYHWLLGQEQFHSGEVNRRQRKGWRGSGRWERENQGVLATPPRSKAGLGCGFRESIFCLFKWQNRLKEPVREAEEAEDKGKELKWGYWEGRGLSPKGKDGGGQLQCWRLDYWWRWRKAKSEGGGRIGGLRWWP